MQHEMTRKKGARTAVLRARVPQELKDRVSGIAEERGADEADVVREAVLRFVGPAAPMNQQPPAPSTTRKGQEVVS